MPRKHCTAILFLSEIPCFTYPQSWTWDERLNHKPRPLRQLSRFSRVHLKINKTWHNHFTFRWIALFIHLYLLDGRPLIDGRLTVPYKGITNSLAEVCLVPDTWLHWKKVIMQSWWFITSIEPLYGHSMTCYWWVKSWCRPAKHLKTIVSFLPPRTESYRGQL